MYVCVCKGVTCGAIRSAVSEGDACCLRDLSRQLGVATQCGKCAHSARQILDAALSECPAAASCPLAADVAA